jgi:hypothetical protein
VKALLEVLDFLMGYESYLRKRRIASQVDATNRPVYRADISKVTAHERIQQLYLDDCFGKRQEKRSWGLVVIKYSAGQVSL